MLLLCNETPTASVTWRCSLTGQEILVTNTHLSLYTPCFPPPHISVYRTFCLDPHRLLTSLSSYSYMLAWAWCRSTIGVRTCMAHSALSNRALLNMHYYCSKGLIFRVGYKHCILYSTVYHNCLPVPLDSPSSPLPTSYTLLLLLGLFFLLPSFLPPFPSIL